MADEGTDAVEYEIYPDACVVATASSRPERLLLLLEELKAACFDIVSPLIKDYIWQHQPFNLDVVSTPTSSSSSLSSSSSSLPHLHGMIKYGDNIDDEWFLVFLLHELSRNLPNISITVRDGDGQFLLIEAAYSLPRWLKPETSSNRVFIRQGCLHFLPPSSIPVNSSSSLQKALEVLARGDAVTKASDRVQQAITHRIGEYPERARSGIHRARCIVPLQVAQILKHEPQLISIAVEAFYRRDIDSVKAVARMKKFLSFKGGGDGNRGDDDDCGIIDMVEVMVSFSRAMYAQLVQQVFQAPRRYPMPPLSSPQFKAAELGMKLTCGFEMMYWERARYEPQEGMQNQNAPDDASLTTPVKLDGVPDSDPGWQVFRSSLQNRGYFKGLMEGSKEHRQLLQAAVERYQESRLFARVSSAMHAPIKCMNDIMAIPCTSSDFPAILQESDDDSWLYDGDTELTSALLERQKEMEAYEMRRASRKQSNKNTTADHETSNEDSPKRGLKEPSFDLAGLAQSMQAFVTKASSYEGAEVPDGDDEVSVNMSRFKKELESALGSSDLFAEFSHDPSAYDLDISDSDMDYGTSYVDGDDAFSSAYSSALEHELHQTSIAKSFITAEDALEQQPEVVVQTGEISDSEDIAPVDVDVNLVTNLLQSYMSQQGLPGPVSNLLGAMGINLPDMRDDKPPSRKGKEKS
ncbi:unnamed protein product [Sphagnum troendelagicum]|uniref:Ecdysoneless n=1 Tax=Sphagnum troendelagicum TaxID=128251 RepID=A0ABP0UVR4_9BRYO